jgi:hypothetical protein
MSTPRPDPRSSEALSVVPQRAFSRIRRIAVGIAIGFGVLAAAAGVFVAVASGDFTALFIVLPVLAIGSAIVLVFLRALSAFEQRVAAHTNSVGDLSPRVQETRPAASSGSIELQPEGTRRRNAIGTLLFGLFWSGIVGVMAFAAVSAGESTFTLAFLGLFGVVGVGMLGAAVYHFAQTLNPRPLLTLARADLALGDEVGCTWRLTGRSAELARFCIRLRGTERASYRRGTDKITKTHVFHDSVIFETDRSGLAQRGSVQLRIPRDSMHSWSASDNRIFWELVVDGDVPRWPDIHDVFEIEIGPRRDDARARN